MNKDNELLKIKNLVVEYHTNDGVVHAVNNIDLAIRKGQNFGLVGETGAGKTTSALSIMKLLPSRTGRMKADQMEFNGIDLLTAKEAEMRAIRGEFISMIFQDPMTSLNPVISVGKQIAEAIVLHNTKKLSKDDVQKEVDRILEMVGIPASRKNEYPHQFSGGMKQRVVIAIALACNPSLIIADEPTTALDVTIQAQILEMIRELKEKLKTSMLLITHDLGVVAETCDDVGIMYAGKIIETGKVEDIFNAEDHHPYTIGLFGSIPDLEKKTDRLSPILGSMPDPIDLPEGCKFNPRCPFVMDICKSVDPPFFIKGTHFIKCHLMKGKNEYHL
jgi:peptide/nickel transport system ATP-binding protein